MKCDSNVRRLRRDESGQTLVLAAIMLPVLIGFVGFAVDVGYAFDYRKQMQLAADSAAMAGAIAVKADGSINSTDLATVVTMDTAANGFPNSGGIAVSVCRPAVDFTCPTTYTYTAGDGAVKVSISQTKDTFFTKVLNFNSLTIGVSAVAAAIAVSGNTSNIVILDTACDTGFSVTGGSSTVSVAGSIYVNACGSNAISLSGGSSSITAGQGIYIGCNSASPPICGGTTSPNVTPTPSTPNPQIADPLASLPEPVPDGTETVYNTNVNISSGTLNPGVYNAGLRIEGSAVTLNPGIYFINGSQLRISGGSTIATGSGVMFYLYNGATFSSSGGPTVTMSAPTSGTYKGIWFFHSRSNTNSVSMTGGIILNIDGVIYISNPATTLTFTGGPSSGALANYTVFVVWKLVMTGGATAFNSDFSTIGGSPLGGAINGLALAE